MANKYVDNSKTNGKFDPFVNDEIVTVSAGGNYLEDVFPTLSIGQVIQIGSALRTYIITNSVGGGEYTIDRNYEGSSGVEDFYFTAPATPTAGTIGDPHPIIRQALSNAVSGDRVCVKWTSDGYKLKDNDQMPAALEPGAGSLLNKPIIIEGFKDNIGDMRWGGTHYQSPLHAHVNGIDTTKKVTISGENALASLLTLDGSEFVIIRNFYFKDATGLIIALANTPANVVFEHCVFADSGSVLEGECNGFSFYDCYITGMDYGVSSYTINCTGAIGAKFVGNVLNISNYINYGFAAGTSSIEGIRGLYYGNLIIGGAYSIFPRPGDAIINNTIYDGVNCIRLGINGQWSPVTIRNNIIMTRLAADKAIYIAGATSGAIDNNNNCFWSVEGVAITNPIVNDVPGGGGAGVIGPNSIEIDPMLTSDYRPREPKVLRGGKADIYGNAGQIGAVLSEHQFKSNSAVSNQGRMRIFK